MTAFSEKPESVNATKRVLTIQKMEETLKMQGNKSCRKCGRVTGIKYLCDDGEERGITLLKSGVCMECEYGPRKS